MFWLISWYSCSTIVFMPYENRPYRGLSVTQVPSLSFTVDLDPLKVKSNHILALHISPTIVTSNPK